MLTNTLHGPFSSRNDGNVVTCSRITAKQYNTMFPETFKVGNWQCNIRILIHIWRHVKSEFCETGHNQNRKYCDWNPLSVVTFYHDWPITDQGGGRSVRMEGWLDVQSKWNMSSRIHVHTQLPQVWNSRLVALTLTNETLSVWLFDAGDPLKASNQSISIPVAWPPFTGWASSLRPSE